MAVAVDHDAGAGVAGPQSRVASACRRLVAVDQGQGPTRQGQLHHLRQVGQEVALCLWPLAGDVVVTGHGDDPPATGLQATQNPGPAQVAAVYGKVAARNDLDDPVIDLAVSVCKDCYPDHAWEFARGEGEGGCGGGVAAARPYPMVRTSLPRV